MKLVFVALTSCLIGTGVGIGALFLTENVSRGDLLGFTPVMLAASLIMCSFFYAPGMFWLKRRKGCDSTRLFLLVAAFVLNAPILLFLLFAASAGRFFSGISEVLLFAAAFVAAGLVFGRGFVWYCGGTDTARR
ncbi:MAG TPA: hypothetical protein VE262_13875 [Blastocatellia bacterium]|nr:hypothetical protein [Blastocatellia bacterium]